MFFIKRVFLAIFLFSATAVAQHSRQTLTQPTCGDYNLRTHPCQVTVVQRYESGSDINFQETYYFDSTGELTEYRKRGFGGENVTRYPLTVEDISDGVLYRFDYDGDVLEMRQFDMQNRLYSSTHYIYAVGGNLAMSVEYVYTADTGVVAKRTVSTYDKHERLKIVEQFTADELLILSEKYKYDRRGNLVRRTQTSYYDEEVVTNTERRRYTYDRNGNWIQCRYFMNGKEMYTIERTIVYY